MFASTRNSVTAFRHVLLCILSCVFVWQTMQSMKIYLDGGTTFSTRTLMKFKQTFPGLSLCPTTFGEDFLTSTNLTYEEELQNAKIPFNIKYTLLFHNQAGK